MRTFDDHSSLVLVRSDPKGEPSTSDVLVHHLSHGNEGQLVKFAQNLLGDSELWIVGNDDALGVGATAVAACILAETPVYRVYSLLFEDHSLSAEDRERIVYLLRKSPLLLEQHMKYSRDGDIFVRRLVYAAAPVENTTVSDTGLTFNSDGVVPTSFLPTVGNFDVQVNIDIFAPDKLSTDKSVLSFVGQVTQVGANVSSIAVGSTVSLMPISTNYFRR